MPELVIMVVAIIIIIAGLATYFPQAWAKLQEMLGWGVGGGSDFEKAVKCSYYRCTKGCKSSEIAYLNFNTQYGDNTPCKTFCSSEWTHNGKDDGTICGWNAAQYPVEILEDTLAKDESEYTTKSFNGMFNCIIPLDTKEGVAWGVVAIKLATITNAGIGCLLPIMGVVSAPIALITCPVAIAVSLFSINVNYNHLIIDTALIDSADYGTCTYDPETSKSLTKFTVKSSELEKPIPSNYIFSGKDENWLMGNKYTTEVVSVQTYIIFKPPQQNVILLDEEIWPKKHRAVADGKDYIFMADISSNVREEKGRDIDKYYCEEPYWVDVSVKNLKDGEVRTARFNKIGDIRGLFNFVLNFTEWERKCATGLDRPPYVWGYTNFNITYYAGGIPADVVPPSPPNCADFTKDLDCTAAGCKWCRKCDGYKVNQWRQDKCVDPYLDCGYICGDKVTPHECGAGSCGEDFSWNPIACYCYPKKGPCLMEGSLISTPDGFKRIEDLKEGDYVIGYKDGRKVESKILEKSEHIGEFKLYFYKGYWFTGNHLVYSDNYKDFKPVLELSNVMKYYEGKVYNIQVESKNYFGENDLLIHNK